MKVTTTAGFLLGFYIALIVWWLTIFLSGAKESSFNLAFAFAYGLLPLFGGFLGIFEAKRWGLFQSSMGKAVFFLSLGLITWGVGEMIWSFYNFILQVEVPYPSWADASFILSWPLWSVGVIFLSYATGAKFGLKGKGGKLQFLIIPIIAFTVSYYLLVTVARQGAFELGGGLLKIFFDIAYPLWDVIIITIATVVYGLSFRFLGGAFKWPVLITLFGFLINYFADFGFSYTTTVGTHYNGNWVDLLFTSAMFALSFGVNSLDSREG